MKQQTENRHQKSGKPRPSPLMEKKALQQKVEQTEVAGRHKNDGQKDHKGARKD